MTSKTTSRRRRRHTSPPAQPSLATKQRPNYARWRALSLSLVYLVFAVHILHWKITGKTLAPLELNEVMYTLELGIITAGFLFMCFLVLGTLAFGRFFCSWACHIMVLQDLCAWILRKLGIRQKPIRSRILLWVPPLTALYMFVWPQVLRAWEARAFPDFHFRSDTEGWASFMTENFWRNLPSAPIIAITFLVCGFAIVYLLGSRTFCTYVCPYGAIFALADRFTPGKIRVTDACQQCGTCTAACTSGVRVHEEVHKHGMVVNPACMKDLDCVSACPQRALHYGFAKPALFASYRSGGRFGLPYDFSWREEILAAFVFVVVLLSFRGLYSRVPFLLSLALGGILAYLAVTTIRMLRQPNVRIATITLRSLGRTTKAGLAFAGTVALLAIFVGHSTFVRYHEYLGLRQARALAGLDEDQDATSLADTAQRHLLTADRWGLLPNERIQRSLIDISIGLQRFDVAQSYASRMLRQFPDDANLHMQLGRASAGRSQHAQAEREFRTVIDRWNDAASMSNATLAAAHQALGELLAARADFDSAAEHFRHAVEIEPDRALAHAELGGALAEVGRLDEAIISLREATRLAPRLSRAHYNLGTIYSHLGRFEEAVSCYEQALTADTGDAEVHNNLGYALLRLGETERSHDHLQRAIALDAQNADAHFNLGVILEARHQSKQALEHYRLAAKLDARYARWLAGRTKP